MKIQTVDGHAPSISSQQVPHPLDGNLLVVKLKEMSTPGTGVAVERFNHTIDFSCSEQELDLSQVVPSVLALKSTSVQTAFSILEPIYTHVPDEVYKQGFLKKSEGKCLETRIHVIICPDNGFSKSLFQLPKPQSSQTKEH